MWNRKLAEKMIQLKKLFVPSLRRNYPVQVQRVLSQPSIEDTPWTMLQIYKSLYKKKECNFRIGKNTDALNDKLIRESVLYILRSDLLYLLIQLF